MLPEDRRYYPEAEEHYGVGVETLVEDEDAQGIDQPIIATEKPKDFDFIEKKNPETTFDNTFLKYLMGNPALIRNVSVYVLMYEKDRLGIRSENRCR